MFFPQKVTSFVSAEEVYFCLGNATGYLAKALVNSCNSPAVSGIQSSTFHSESALGGTERYSVCSE